MTKNLMIVESPAKAKTIEKFLGKDFTVKSCYGHIRDLRKGNNAIDVDNNYTPEYVVSDDKASLVKELKSLASKAEEVWLATDEDREGEAISWHLCEVLGLDETSAKRIVFHEITKPAILKAVGNPRYINKDLVDAQQARRILDRLVGFELSPILWRKISRSSSLSAGRVQSVAVRIVVERERDISNFEGANYFKASAIFKVKDAKGKIVHLKAELSKKIKTEQDAEAFLSKCIKANYTIEDIKVKPAKKSPTAPFTTSTLQQDASRKLGFAVARTMRVAQKLYEAGKITYMRTDSTYLSETALENAHKTINANYGKEYLQPRSFKGKSKMAQEAHEAIRPTYFEESEAGSNADEKKLYSLIWKRTLASQMSDARLERTTAMVGISTTDEKLVAKGEVLKFDGFLKLYRESVDDEDQQEDTGMLPPLHIGQVLDLKEMKATQRFQRPPARYNEATLVKKMEELGIGRPSTYAPTISTIQKRNYVVKENREGKKRNYIVWTLTGPDETPKGDDLSRAVNEENTGVEKNKLFPTDMGKLVNDFLVEHFSDVLNYGFTAQIEKQFDEIADGQKQWNNMIDTFYKPFHETVEHTMETATKVTGERVLGEDPKTGKVVKARLGRFGPMVQLGEMPAEGEEGPKPKYASIIPPLTLETVALEDALELFKLPREVGEFEGEVMKASEGRFGPYILHNKKFYSLKKDEQHPLTITAEEAIQLIKDKREADAKKLIKTFPEDPDIQILHGRWGPYIKAPNKNVKIPKERKETPETLTYEEVKDLVDKAPEKKGRGKKAAAKKPAAKKKATTTKKPAAKKKTTTAKKATAKKPPKK